GRRGGAPDAATAPERPHAQPLAQQLEVMRFAEERGEIGRKRIGEFFPLGAAVRLHQVQVAAKAAQLERPHSPSKTAVDHLLLVLAQRDSRALVYEPAHALEV